MAQPDDLATLLAEGAYDEAVAEARRLPESYLKQLIDEALRAHLDTDPQWRALLHYREGLFGGWTSEVDGESFFTSRRGKIDPRQELLTTLASFFSTRPVPPTTHTPQCRFLARYTWLSSRLHFDTTRMPAQSCHPYEAFYGAVDPVGLTVVFPASHPNSPSSMFGHLLIRIDSRGHTDASRMLDYTINYAADAGPVGGASYAVKGLAGGFPGRFRIIPYHMKLREYAQMENRDIWEYRLDVSQPTVDMVLMHAWELLGTYFDYYFFTENCAYHLLTLLESDLYDRRMTDEFHLWVLPTDTLRVLDARGLVKEVDYDPSAYRLIVARRAGLSREENDLAKAIYQDGTEPHRAGLHLLPPGRRAAVLDMAYEYLRYTRTAASDALDPELSERERRLLIARSRLRIASPPPPVLRPRVRPDQGHGTSRASVGAGVDANGSFLTLGWRPVYHDWLDPAPGYPPNFALEFGRLDLRCYTSGPSQGHIKLDRLHLINLDNFEPLDDFFRRLSWHLTTGWESLFNAADEDGGALFLRGGVGLSLRPGGDTLLLYTGVDGEAARGDDFRDDYAIGAGATAGVMGDLGDRWRLRAAGRYLLGVAGETRDRALLETAGSLRLTADTALNLGFGWTRRLDGWMAEGSLWLNVYF